MLMTMIMENGCSCNDGDSIAATSAAGDTDDDDDGDDHLYGSTM